MRILNMLVITIAIVSLATIATAQTTAREINMGYIETIYKVPIPAVGSTKIDPTKVKFLSIAPCRVEYGASSDGTTIVMRVIGIVARDVELGDDAIAQQLLQMEIAFGREQCPPGGEFYDDGVLKRDQYDRHGNLRRRSTSLSLYFGDPMTFTPADIQKFFDDRKRWIRGNTAYDQLLDNVYGYWGDDKPGLIINYTNYIKALKQDRAYKAQKAREQEAALERQRQAEQLRRSQIAARLAAFVKANKVRRFVSGSQFAANPFVYEGQVVAMSCTFVRMNSATQGVFSTGNYSFVVSGIPTARFTRPGSLVLLAGRVLGNIEVKPGPALVPHLSFVGSVFCQQWNCSDYIASN